MSRDQEVAADRVLRVGLVQMCSSRSTEENLAETRRGVAEAASKGAAYVQTPEFTTLMEMSSKRLFAETKPEENNAALAELKAMAREFRVHLHVGSMGVLVSPDKIANRSYLITPDGEMAASYDKIHMFDAALGGSDNFRESKNFAAGGKAVVARAGDAAIGLSICYDVRFPGLYRALAKAGADIIAIPSAFTQQTGDAHWHTLLRCRAIETGAWVVAAAQTGRHACGRDTYGHSLVISPWGEVVADGGVQQSVIVTDINLDDVASARRRMPSLKHDRPFAIVNAAARGSNGEEL